MARAAHVVRVTLDSTRLVRQPDGAARPASRRGTRRAARYDVYCSSQGMSMMRADAARHLRPARRSSIRVHARDVGGGFGIRSQPYTEYGALMVAAQQARPAGEVGRLALRDHRHRPPRPRGAALGRAGARPRRPLHRPALRLGLQHGRLLSQAGPMINTHQPGDARDQRLRHPRALRPPQAGLHQHHADHRLPRRRPAERHLSRRAPGRRGGAGDRHRPDRAAPAQPDPDGRRSRTRRRPARPTTAAIPRAAREGHRVFRLEDFREAQRSESKNERQAARHRLRDVRRAVRPGRRCRRKRRSSSSASRATPSSTRCRARPGRGTRRCTRRSSARSSASRRSASRCGRATRTARALAGGGTVGSRSTMQHGGALAATAYESDQEGAPSSPRRTWRSPPPTWSSRRQFRVKGTDVSVTMKKIIEKHGSRARHARAT